MMMSPTASTTTTPARSTVAIAPADHPGRWIGGVLGALVSLALVPLELIMEWPRWAGPDALATLGLLGAPVGFALGRQAFPEARSGGWGHALGIGALVGVAAPPLGLMMIALVGIFLPESGTAPHPLSSSGLLILMLGIPACFVALPVTLPVGLLWGVLVRLVPREMPARLRVPPPFDRLGIRHAAIVVAIAAVIATLAWAGALS
jgi:hypothetical protein